MEPEERPSLCNMWWAASIASVLLTFLGVILEYRGGTSRDFWLAVGLAGLSVAFLIGAAVATRLVARHIRNGTAGVTDGLDGITRTLDRILVILDERLPGRDRNR
jgi:hypothetical protein